MLDPEQDTQMKDDCETRYEMLEKLGEGTYGVVYKAFDSVTSEVSSLLHTRPGCVWDQPQTAADWRWFLSDGTTFHTEGE